MATPSLYDRLLPLAAHARRMMVRVARVAYTQHEDHVNRSEYTDFSVTAAFDAFVHLGGDPEAPDAFDWVGRQRDLRRTTARNLRRRIRTELELDNDETLRARVRRDGASVEETRWDAWRDNETRTENGRTTDEAWSGVNGLGDSDAPQERLLQEAALQELGAELATLLSAEDLDLITQHYFKGVSQATLAAELSVVNGLAMKRNEGTINVRMHRAKGRLRARLAPKWRTMLQEA